MKLMYASKWSQYRKKTIIYNAILRRNLTFLIWCEVVISSVKMFQLLFSVREKPEKPNFPGKIALKCSNNAMLLPH